MPLAVGIDDRRIERLSAALRGIKYLAEIAAIGSVRGDVARNVHVWITRIGVIERVHHVGLELEANLCAQRQRFKQPNIVAPQTRSLNDACAAVPILSNRRSDECR